MICQYFGSCGGCTAQHIPYEVQLENKRKRVISCSKRAGYDGDVLGVQVFSGKELGYRNRMDFVFHPHGLGLRRQGHFDRIIDVDSCPIANPGVNRLLSEVRELFKGGLDHFDLRSKEGTFKYCVIRATGFADDSSLSFVLNEDSSRLGPAIERLKGMSFSASHVAVAYVKKESDVSVSDESFMLSGSPFLTERLGDFSLAYPIQGFFQNNPEMALALVDHCRGLLEKYDTVGSRLLDLYGGVGTFGISLHSLFKEVHVVESVPGAIEAAKQNIQANQASNVSAFCKDASSVREQSPFVITDPPRTGMDQRVLRFLRESRPACLIYVSCNPDQLGKELPRLGLSVKSAAVFDLFPQTPHVETVVELVRA